MDTIRRVTWPVVSSEVRFAGEFGRSFMKVAWEDDGLSEGLRKGPERIGKELDAICAYLAPEVENWMKYNAPWKDQTSNARNGLAARPFSDGDGHGIVLYHQVPYGIWLEVRFSGRYAIIVPAMEEWGPRVMDSAKNLLRRI